jgi:hypothetical protein
MRTFRLLGITALTTALLGAGALASPNLALNPDFQDVNTGPDVHRSGGGLPFTDSTGLVPDNLVGDAAAQSWLTWTTHVGGRVRTWLVPSELYGPGRTMLHVQVSNGLATRGGGVDEVFLPVPTGPKHADFCVVLKIVSGAVWVGAGLEGNSDHGATVVRTVGSWVAVRGSSETPPVDQLAVFAWTPDADYYVQQATVTTDPIQPKDCVVPAGRPDALPQRLVKPDPYPWTLHPAQGAPQPAPDGNDQPSPYGHFDNMRPPGSPVGGGPNPAETEDHERGHDHGGGKDDKGGGKGQPAAPNTLPASPNTIQQQQSGTNQ